MGQQGHLIVCELAYSSLSKPQQHTINNLIDQLPTSQRALINKRLNRPQDASLTFSQSCIWADAIRELESYGKYSTWHYVNVVRDSEKIVAIEDKRPDILSAMVVHDWQFKNAENVAEQLEALLFISHWFADIHQPLHVSFESDRGGNDTQVQSRDKRCKNLHQVWDNCLLRDLKMNQEGWRQAFTQVQAQERAQFNGVVSTENILQWSNESLAITRSKIMAYCHYAGNSRCEPGTEAIQYNDYYIQQNSPVLKRQMLRAASRLGVYLTNNLP
ncbi:S1/P1 nuclease [Thalassotalea sp. PS06]|uniref:S1/P1 nuclease n=1 Tax=Thalassotalea sp. PS06 TaxID=2594005 RepID=UPI00163D6967|nr:S1/P1 nuclease [Thalassotalea sp. PS06]